MSICRLCYNTISWYQYTWTFNIDSKVPDELKYLCHSFEMMDQPAFGGVTCHARCCEVARNIRKKYCPEYKKGVDVMTNEKQPEMRSSKYYLTQKDNVLAEKELKQLTKFGELETIFEYVV